jgi:hypothetical protein
MTALHDRISRAFALTEDLANHLEETDLLMDLPGLPSNRVAGQFWCIVGARESYCRAIVAGRWQGFSCSLNTPRSKPSLIQALQQTAAQFSATPLADLTTAQVELAFALLEHEVQHHGQLIRYVYANRLSFPASWNARYTV